MARVRRQNVILTIKDEDIKHYLNLGYKVIDDNNNVIAGEEPDYKQLYFQEREKNIALENELKQYRTFKELGDVTPVVDEPVEKEPVEEPKPKRRSRKSKEEAQEG